MPKYDYRCTSCGVVYERKEGFDALMEHACERCGGSACRVFVAPPILFKGSGWYITDSKSGAATGTSPAKAATNGDQPPTAEKPADNKPAEAKGELAAAKSE